MRARARVSNDDGVHLFQRERGRVVFVEGGVVPAVDGAVGRALEACRGSRGGPRARARAGSEVVFDALPLFFLVRATERRRR